jgi:hypothetical protein
MQLNRAELAEYCTGAKKGAYKDLKMFQQFDK